MSEKEGGAGVIVWESHFPALAGSGLTPAVEDLRVSFVRPPPAEICSRGMDRTDAGLTRCSGRSVEGSVHVAWPVA